MKVAAKTEYACLAILELAARYGSGEPVRIRDIAEPHGIPARFLVQILLQLKSAGLVNSTRGAAGGYQLVKSPEEITLGEVMAVIEGAETEPTSNLSDTTPTAHVLLDAWRKIADVHRQMLASITFAELADQVRRTAEHMYYI